MQLKLYNKAIKRKMEFPRFSGHLLITLRRLQCLDIPNLKRHGFIQSISKSKQYELSLRDDVLSKEVAQALDIHPFMLARWRKEYREGKFSTNHATRATNELMSKLPTKKELNKIKQTAKRK